MAGDYWYADAMGKQQGPVADDELKRLLDSGAISHDALIWTQGMAGWQPAREIAAFAPLGIAPPPLFPISHTSPGTSPNAAPAIAGGSLETTVTAWGLFWRFLLLAVATPLIIPAPWVSVMYWRYFTRSTILPGGRPLRFEGQLRDIWYVFVAAGVLFWVGQISSNNVSYGQVLSLPLSTALGYFVLRWVCRNLWLTSNEHRFAFSAGFWGYVGWAFLLTVSFVTIIGWAWVFSAYLRWLTRHVDGEVHFGYRGSGWGILWRSVLGLFASGLVIPIPWVMRWIYRYIITHVTAEPRGFVPARV